MLPEHLKNLGPCQKCGSIDFGIWTSSSTGRVQRYVAHVGGSVQIHTQDIASEMVVRTLARNGSKNLRRMIGVRDAGFSGKKYRFGQIDDTDMYGPRIIEFHSQRVELTT